LKELVFILWDQSRKDLSDDQKKEYAVKFEEYFLKSFSSRLAEYTNPEIDVFNKEVLNENYTIVNSILKATSERPEVKID
jgi:phospholipid transport system substrate-binding protein